MKRSSGRRGTPRNRSRQGRPSRPSLRGAATVLPFVERRPVRSGAPRRTAGRQVPLPWPRAAAHEPEDPPHDLKAHVMIGSQVPQRRTNTAGISETGH